MILYRILVLCVAIMLTCSSSARFTAQASNKDFIVVIDAGHGGHDHGALGKITNEKNINLGVALKLGKMLKQTKGVKVIYTRDDDRFVTLQGRADIANKANGDLFVSIHTNSVDKKSKNRLTVSGASVYTLGFRRSQENLEVAMRENSVMKLESDYSTVYEGFDPSSDESYIIFEMSQNKHMEHSVDAALEVQKELVATAQRKDHGVRQANFWVLFKTGMPSMLIELDFICNPTVEKFLDSTSGQTDLATAIYNGIMSYKHLVDKENAIISGEKVSAMERRRLNPSPIDTVKDVSISEPAPEATTHEDASASSAEPASSRRDQVVYKIQFLTHTSKLQKNSTAFKGLENVGYYKDGKTYKYTYGEYQSQKGASVDLQHVKKLFSDAFVIKTINGERIK